MILLLACRMLEIDMVCGHPGIIHEHQSGVQDNPRIS